MRKIIAVTILFLSVLLIAGCSSNEIEADITPPVIEADNVVIIQNSMFDPMADVSVTDNVSTNISLSITVNNVDVSEQGVYTVTYYAKDEAGNEFYKTISVTVTS